MNSNGLLALLSKRYADQEWAFFAEVNQGTGGHAGRRADAVAMNLWPSRGLAVHGFEIKTSRADWKRELADPSKSAPIQKFCDYWWVVVNSPDLIQPGELPPTWGVLAPTKRGDKLRIITDAPKLQPEEFTRTFFASLCRSAKTYTEPDEVLKAKLAKEYQRGKATGKESAEYDLNRIQRDLDKLQSSIDTFEQNSGVKIDYWTAGKIGSAVNVILQGHDSGSQLTQLKAMELRMSNAIEHVAKAITELEVEAVTP